MRENYTEWQITNDGSIMAGYYPALAVPPREFRAPGFKFSAAELVSPPFPAGDISRAMKDETFEEIRTCVQAVTGYLDNSIGAFADKRCGLHVHIGSQSDILEDPFPTRVLQHFAMMLIHFEKAINKLHPNARTDRPSTQAGNYARTNRAAFFADGHSCNDPRFPDARKDSPRLVFAPGMTTEILSCIMGGEDHLDSHTRSFLHGLWQPNRDTTNDDWSSLGFPRIDKYRAVRWELLIQNQRPKTLEFRQAAGTLDEERVKTLVNFYIHLIRHAERLAHDYPSDQKCVDFWEPIINKVLERNVQQPSLKELLTFLELDASSAEVLHRSVRDYSHDSWLYCAKVDHCHKCSDLAKGKKEKGEDKHRRQAWNARNKRLAVQDLEKRLEDNKKVVEWVAEMADMSYVPRVTAWIDRHSDGNRDEGLMPERGW